VGVEAFTTLVVGPTGTGKELVAQAIGLSRYIPFNPRKRVFTEDPSAAFFPLNLATLSPTLIESELFGHRKGRSRGRSPTAKAGSRCARPAGRCSSTRSGRWSRRSR
jgi:transcriptional regulator with AAA-type ATPase domain